MSSTSFSDPAVLARRHAMATELRAIDISVTVVALVIVLLRLWARSKSAAGFGWDDCTIIIATVVMFGNLALNLLMVENGLGLQVTEVQISELIMIGKSIYADEIVYVIHLALVKVSILIMYCRIFDLPSFRIGAWILSLITIIWSLMFIFICIFQCTPIPRAWNPTIPGKCLYLRGIFIGNAVPNIVTDVAILMMPLYHVWKLQVRFVQRVTLTFIFLLGCFVIFASIYRFITVLQLDQNNISYTLKTPTTWSHIECCTAVISACLPCMRPLLNSFLASIGIESSKSGSNNYTGSRGTGKISWKQKRSQTVDSAEPVTAQSGFEEWGDEEDRWSGKGGEGKKVGEREIETDGEGDEVPLRAIKVVTTVEVDGRGR